MKAESMISLRFRWLFVMGAMAAGSFAGLQPAAAQIPGYDDNTDVRSPEELIDSAIAKIDKGDFAEADAEIRRAKALNPKLDKIQLAEGLLLVETGAFLQAVGKFQAYNESETGRQDHRGFAALGDIWMQSRNYRGAIRPLELAKSLTPPDEDGTKTKQAKITMDLAFAYLGLDRRKEAMDVAKQAELLSPRDASIQLRLAQLAARANDATVSETALGRAISLLRAEIAADPFDKDSPTELKDAYDLLMRIKLVDIRVDPEKGEPYFVIAQLAKEMADIDMRINLLKAREWALEATKKDERNANYNLFLAHIELSLSALEDAKARVQDILARDATNAEAAQLLQDIDAALAAKSASKSPDTRS